jgi:hypothetical protein
VRSPAAAGQFFQMPVFLNDTDYAWSQGSATDDGDIWYGGTQLSGDPGDDAFNDYDPSFGRAAGSDVVFFSRHDGTGSSDIFRVSLNGTGLTPVAADPLVSEDHPSYSVANDMIVFEEEVGKDDIWVMKPDGTGRVRVTSDADYDHDDPVWSPDGQWIVWEQSPVADESMNRIVKIAWPLVGGDPIPLTEWTLNARRPAMKPR